MIKKIFKEKTNSLSIQFFRYGIVGGIASVVDYGMMLLFKEVFLVYYLIAGGIGFCAGLVVNYILSILWVFPVKTMENKFLEFAIFGVIGGIGLGLLTLFLWFFTDIVSIDYKISKIIAMILVLFWNFLARKYVLFHYAGTKKEETCSDTAAE
ncbi:MAG: GtrA family protein [Spirochaetales bacterium]|nr:GtrA family protein [Spirochaetales bacterium]